METALRRALLPILPLLLAGPATAAEDFSGFYAGINAGYALGRGREARPGGPIAGASADRDGAGSELPPSAAGAVGTMRRTGRSAGAPPAR